MGDADADADVLVLGRGLGACTAALAASTAGDDTTSVRLVGGSDRPFDRATGLIDVLGTRPDERGPVVDPFDALDALAPTHPYRVLDQSALRAGLATFDAVADGDYRGSHTDANALLLTLLGNPTPAARYPAPMADGLTSRPDDTLLVGLREVPDFHAPWAAERLAAADVPFAVDGVTVSAPVDVGTEPPALAVARALDENNSVGARNETVREALARTVASVYDGQARVGFPAVLGLTETAAVHATLAAEIDADIFEVPLGPPNVPGRRLESLLLDSLRERGVEVSLGVDVERVETDDGSIDRVHVSGVDGLAAVDPGAVVLATGGPAGGGIVAEREGLREPVFDCHVPHPDDRSSWGSVDPLGDHPLARAGVRIDADARPVDESHSRSFDALFAAGSVVGGYDPAAEGSGAGVALATGHVAGTRAAER